MPVITRSKKQTVTGLRELCDEAHITFIDEVLKNKCPFDRSILPLITLLLLLYRYLDDNINCTHYYFLMQMSM